LVNHTDVFINKRFTGTPLAVVLDSDGLDTVTREEETLALLASAARLAVTADTARRSGAHQAMARPEIDDTVDSPGGTPAT
jgi:predicted PhzF superfamily epimerase YddE/YHI9